VYFLGGPTGIQGVIEEGGTDPARLSRAVPNVPGVGFAYPSDEAREVRRIAAGLDRKEVSYEQSS
jgi:hypothetical protein